MTKQLFTWMYSNTMKANFLYVINKACSSDLKGRMQYFYLFMIGLHLTIFSRYL